MKTRSMVVSLIGRPNVGKSTIFNRLMRQAKLAMTHDQPGVTRDRHYGILTLDESDNMDKKSTEEIPDEDVILVDTGGFYPEKIEVDTNKKKNNVDPFFNLMADHAKLAIDESDLVLFVVDVREGMLPYDKQISNYIRSTKKPVWLLMNKFDSEKQEGDHIDFYQLGLDDEDMFRISAEHNRGLYTLRERLKKQAMAFKEKMTQDEEEHLQKGVKPRHEVVSSVAIVGAPNAGKSTLLNCLVGAQRALVSDIAGTTVDPIEGYIDLWFGPDVEVLKEQVNQFRRSDEAIIEEMKFFGERGDIIDEDPALLEAEEKIYIEYGQSAPEAGFDAEFDANSEFNFDENVTEEDFFSDKDIETTIAAELNAEESEVVEEEKENFEFVNRFRSIKLVDTAGIRRAKQVEGFIETQSVYRSLRSITESDVVIFMVDATLGITHQDRRLLDIALEKGKSLIICLNKIDLLKDIFADNKKKREWMQELQDEIPWLSFCQLVTISAKSNRNINYLREALRRTIVTRHRKVPTGALNRSLTSLVEKNPVSLAGAGSARFKVKYASMIKSDPPTFLLFSNKSQGIPVNYRKYLVNGLRREFKLVNTPVHLIFRTSTDIERRMKKIEKNTGRSFTK